MNYLNNKISELISEHTGGEKFFDELDNFIREDKSIIDEFLKLYQTRKKTNYPELIILSGKFGNVMINNLVNNNVMLINGGLRIQETEVEFMMSENKINEVKDSINHLGPQKIKVYFMDDSFYSGKTRDKINNKLKEVFNLKIHQTYVVYDGSKEKQNNVISMFRYHPN